MLLLPRSLLSVLIEVSRRLKKPTSSLWEGNRTCRETKSLPMNDDHEVTPNVDCLQDMYFTSEIGVRLISVLYTTWIAHCIISLISITMQVRSKE